MTTWMWRNIWQSPCALMLLNQWWRMKNMKKKQLVHGTSLCFLSLNLHPSSLRHMGLGCCSSPISVPSYQWFYSYTHSLDSTPCDSRCIWSSPCSSCPCPCKDSNTHQEIWVCLASSCPDALNPWISYFIWMDSKLLQQELGICLIWWCPSILSYLARGLMTPWI